MRKPKPQLPLIPPCSPSLFPHREFAPWIALTRVFDLIADALKHPQVASDLGRLQVPLLDAAERIVEVASGGLSLPRWHRRIATSVKLCHDARESLPAYVAAGSLTEREGESIASGIDLVIDGLVDAYVYVELPDHIKVAMATLPVDHSRTRH